MIKSVVLNKTLFYIIFFTCSTFLSYAQNESGDTVVTVREFNEELNSKYNSEDFIYIDPEVTEPIDTTPPDVSWLDDLLAFLWSAFPVVIVLLVVIIVVRALVNKEGGWFFGRSPDKAIKKLDLIDEEEIENIDFDERITKAIANQDYRLATRYYYLLTLKKLSEKSVIKIDKDKTNSDYQFEISNQESRKQFSYLSYLYDYVWYGEFPIDELSFVDIQTIFKDYTKTI